MILTTTNSVEGRKIIKYFDPVSKSVVLGTNAIADLGASFTDFFGGRSGNYESRLQTINDKALEMLRKHSVKLKANAVLGVKMDIGEISGSGKNMLMVTVIGTPVVLDKEDIKLVKNVSRNSHVLVNEKLRAKRIISSDKKIENLSAEDIQFIVQSGFEEFTPIIKAGLVSLATCDPIDKDNREKLLRRVLNIFDNMLPELSKEVLFGWVNDDSIPAIGKSLSMDAIHELELIDYEKAEVLLRQTNLLTRKIGLAIINKDKETYSEADINSLKNFSGEKIIQQFPTAELFEEKGIMGTKIKWTCQCGSKNSDKDNKCLCGRDNRGFFDKDISPTLVQLNINDKLNFLQELTEI